MAQDVRTSTSSSSNWWSDLWNGLAQAIGWVSIAVGANQCIGANEYYDPTTQQCIAVPDCGPNGHFDFKSKSCVSDIGAEPSMTTWLLIIGGLVVVFLIILFVWKR